MPLFVSTPWRTAPVNSSLVTKFRPWPPLLACLAVSLISACNTLAPEAPSPEPQESAAVPTGGQGPEALVRMGDFAREQGETDSAISLYRQAHVAAPEEPEPLLKLGQALAETGQFQEAAGAFQTALTLQPTNGEALRGLGNAQIGLGRPDAALQTLETIAGREENASVLNSIGVAQDLLGRHGEARDTYQKALALAPADLDLASNLALSNSLMGNHSEAINQMRRTAAAPLATARHRRNLAMLLFFAGSETEAQSILSRDLGQAEIATTLDRFARWNAIGDSGAKAAAIGSGR